MGVALVIAGTIFLAIGVYAFIGFWVWGAWALFVAREFGVPLLDPLSVTGLLMFLLPLLGLVSFFLPTGEEKK